jgi:hypothetical protein
MLKSIRESLSGDAEKINIKDRSTGWTVERTGVMAFQCLATAERQMVCEV